MTDDTLDAIMHVMEQAFDPVYGEAWNRRQVSDALMLANTHCVVIGAGATGLWHDPAEAVGFALLRKAADEEELLLLAVAPQHRRKGVGHRLLERAMAAARERGSAHLFLEMRDGNPAEFLYRAFGFEQIGRRPGYYRGAVDGPIDAVTFAKRL
ncbi:GNAT family N-acetyltransferase [Aurantiacibacter suaedae]|uniref:GNAT family N-acetyltransferase n=1 Tax=Aurantiacibacter suaedae TaxID=2545755 RepID=UPI0010F96E1A|nr:GNAT family N-acetyltransferase [Aurantiacibacter suaedae]